MIVISDTTPLHYLVLIGHEGVLPILYGRIVLPLAVALELQNTAAPWLVRQFLQHPPSWLEIRSAITIDTTIRLGPGETEAIKSGDGTQGRPCSDR